MSRLQFPKSWRFALILCVANVAAGALQPRDAAAQDTADYGGIAPKVVEAWKKVGGEFRGMYVTKRALVGGNLLFYAKEHDWWLPAFSFERLLAKDLKRLPEPAGPFGLIFPAEITIDLKELARFKTLRAIFLPETATNSTVKDLGFLAGLQWLTFHSDSKITDDGLQCLAALKQLKALSLVNMKITDAALKGVAQLKHLERLNLFNTKVSDAGLEHLSKLEKLEVLILDHTKVKDAGMNRLVGLKRLKNLSLLKCAVGDEGMKNLGPLPELRGLSLSETRVGNEGLKHIAKMPELGELGLDSTAVGDAGLKHLSSLMNLRSLDLSATKITDAGLHELIAIRSLRSVQLGARGVTAKGRQELRTKRKDMDVFPSD